MGTRQLDMKKQRNSNVEVLRIVAMLMIVASHYSHHGGIDLSQMSSSFNYLLLKTITLGNLGVDVFVLLFGYYSVSREHVELRKVFLLWSQVFTYSFLIFCGAILLGVIDFSFSAFVKSILPTIFSKYWFFTAYIVFLLLSPYINKMLKALTRKEYELLLIIMLIIWGIIPTMFSRVPSGDTFVIFLLLYSLGAYFKLFPENKWNNKKSGFCMISISAFLLFGSSVAFFYLKRLHPLFEGKEIYFYHKNSIFVILFALGMLIVSLNKQSNCNKIVNRISSCTFGIYLLHDNDLIRTFIWNDVFGTSRSIDPNSPYLICHCLGAVMTIFGVGIIIELLRKYTFEKMWLCIYELVSKITRKAIDKTTKRGNGHVTIYK